MTLSLPVACCCALAAIAPATTPVPGPQPPNDTVRLARSAYLMGTTLHLELRAANRNDALSASEAAFAEVRRLEAMLSSWRPESELSQLNRATVGAPRQLPNELYDLLRELDRWVQDTEGAFDPAVGPLVDAWELRGTGSVPEPARLRAALEASGWDAFRFLARGRAVRLRSGAWMTAGAFGKGAALRSVAEELRAAGIEAALLDFGGQLLALGSPGGGEGWRASVAHPNQRGTEFMGLILRDESAATSGASERFVEVDGVRYGHVIDPRTGRPVEAWGSVTVVAKDPLVADVLSTALFVMGPEAAKSWLSSHAGIEALLLTLEDGTVHPWYTPGLAHRLIDKSEGSGV